MITEGVITATSLLTLFLRLLARILGLYPSSFAVFSTLARTPALMG